MAYHLNNPVTEEKTTMKKLLCLLLALCLASGCLIALAEEAAAPGLQKDLVILYTSDVHCGIDQHWVYASLLAMKNKYAGDNYVMLVDNGDAIQGETVGTMTRGSAIIDIMNTVGYDIAIPGNHDFDYGMDVFMDLTQKADFPYISCNFNKEGELVFAPYIIREIDGVRFAFVGVTTPTTPRTSTPRYFQDSEGRFIYGFMQDETGEKLYAAVQKAVDDARAEGADYVIVLAHLGNEAESSPWMYSDVIANTTGIDVLLDGHSHDTEQVVMNNKNGEQVIRSACGTKLEHIGVLTITRDGRISAELQSWKAALSAPFLFDVDNEASKAVADAKSLLSDALNKVVASTSVDLVIYDPETVTGDGKPVRIIRRAETNLGDLVADAYLDQSGEADIAMVNGGGIRIALKAGDLTLNDIMTVHPYGNSLTVIEVTGQQVLDALEWSVHLMPEEFGGFDQVAGMTFKVDPETESPVVMDENGMFVRMDDSKPRRISDVQIHGEPLDPEKIYKLASHNYQLLEHGDGYTMFDGAKVLQDSVKLDYQALIDYITQTLGGKVGEEYANPYGDGRIVSVKAE